MHTHVYLHMHRQRLEFKAFVVFRTEEKWLLKKKILLDVLYEAEISSFLMIFTSKYS